MNDFPDTGGKTMVVRYMVVCILCNTAHQSYIIIHVHISPTCMITHYNITAIKGASESLDTAVGYIPCTMAMIKSHKPHKENIH